MMAQFLAIPKSLLLANAASLYPKGKSYGDSIPERSIVLLVMVVMLIGAPSLLAQQSGLSFLEIGVSAREEAMGNVGLASVKGAAANYYNPARLLEEKTGTILFTQNLWLFETQSSSIAAAFPMEESAFGVAMQWFSLGDIPFRTTASEDPIGVFTAQNMAFSASFAHRITEGMTIAATGKLVYEKIFIDDALGAALDLAVQYTIDSSLSLAASVRNLGAMSALSNEATTLPTLFVLGSAYTYVLHALSSHITVEANVMLRLPTLMSEAVISPEGTLSRQAQVLHLGAEFQFEERFSVRAGYVLGQTARQFSAGVGLRFGAFQFDYAFIPFSEQLGSATLLTLHYRY